MKLSDELRSQLIESSEWKTAGIKKPMLSEETAEVETEVEADEAPVEEIQEAVHACPLCVSQLDEPIEEERILEHLNTVMGLVDRLANINEGDEDIDTVIDEAIAELLLQTTDEEETD